MAKPIFSIKEIDNEANTTLLALFKEYDQEMSEYSNDGSTYNLEYYTKYISDSDRKAFKVVVGDTLVGFILINKATNSKESEWNVGEFFIQSKHRNIGIGRKVISEVWELFPAIWEVSVLPNNLEALSFWRKTIDSFSKNNYAENLETVDYDIANPERIIFTFSS